MHVRTDKNPQPGDETRFGQRSDGNGTDIGVDRAEAGSVCAHCGQPGGSECAYGDRQAVVHPHCRGAWIAAQEASLNRRLPVVTELKDRERATARNRRDREALEQIRKGELGDSCLMRALAEERAGEQHRKAESSARAQPAGIGHSPGPFLAPDDLTIPTFLQRGHADCVLGSSSEE